MSGIYRVGLYARLSKDDGDKPDSDSIKNQFNMLKQYCANDDELQVVKTYTDDGYTGTNFNRPDFKRMISDAENGIINCIIVKDLSRFGRDYIDTGAYLERLFPEQGIRFIAVNDRIDSNRGPYDMMLPLKNIFNAQYAKDISGKIRSSFDTKRKAGQFIGAFCSYGYCKDPNDHNHLLIDETAAGIVKRIFNMFESGKGKDSIARILNNEGIPCPSEYKRIMGDRYRNGKKLDATTYWTYSTVSRILSNRMYAGDMVQARYVRKTMHGKAKKQDKDQWIVAEHTHDAIISREQWERVQAQLQNIARVVDFSTDNNPFFGYIKCGDCKRGMVYRSKGKEDCYYCGSYERYGAKACTKHKIRKRDLEAILLQDLNSMIESMQDRKTLLNNAVQQRKEKLTLTNEKTKIMQALERATNLKKGIYEDYKDGLISREDYFAYKKDYEQKEANLKAQLARFEKTENEEAIEAPWVKLLLEKGRIDVLDRATIAETVQSIYVYEDGRIEITYRFTDELAHLFQDAKFNEEKSAER